jgi:hypothetical protein
MPGAREGPEAVEFLVVSLPDNVAAGSTLRLLGAYKSRANAEKGLTELDPSVLGRVAVLERKALYSRRPAVESVPLEEPIISDK